MKIFKLEKVRVTNEGIEYFITDDGGEPVGEDYVFPESNLIGDVHHFTDFEPQGSDRIKNTVGSK